MCDALDALENDSAGNEVAHSEDADRRYAERLRAELDEERRANEAANGARDAAYARSLQRDSARARAGRRPRPAMRPTRGRYSRTARRGRARGARGSRDLAQRAAPAPSDEELDDMLTPETGRARLQRANGPESMGSAREATSRRRRRGSRHLLA